MFITFAFGSNLGNREAYINQSIELLRENGLQDIKISSFVRSEPVDCPEGSGEFVNGAATATWDGSPLELLDLFQKVELDVGRLPKVARDINAPRVVDLDILLFGDLEIESNRLTVPHPRMWERDFVLGPLNELIPNHYIPYLAKTVRQMWTDLENSEI